MKISTIKKTGIFLLGAGALASCNSLADSTNKMNELENNTFNSSNNNNNNINNTNNINNSGSSISGINNDEVVTNTNTNNNNVIDQKEESDDVEETCPICQEPVDSWVIPGRKHQNLINTPGCSHQFHLTCLSSWLKINSICPLCRGPISQQLVSKELSDFKKEFDAIGYRTEHLKKDGGYWQFTSDAPPACFPEKSEKIARNCFWDDNVREAVLQRMIVCTKNGPVATKLHNVSLTLHYSDHTTKMISQKLVWSHNGFVIVLTAADLIKPGVYLTHITTNKVEDEKKLAKTYGVDLKLGKKLEIRDARTRFVAMDMHRISPAKGSYGEPKPAVIGACPTYSSLGLKYCDFSRRKPRTNGACAYDPKNFSEIIS